MNWNELQKQLSDWQAKNFPPTEYMQKVKPLHLALGIAEEVGELAEATIGVKKQELLRDAIGDVAIYATQLCTYEGLKLSTMIGDAEYQLTMMTPIPHKSRDNVYSLFFILSSHAGKVCHCVLKRDQGIRKDWMANAIELRCAIATIFAMLMVICEQLGYDFAEVYAETAKTVLARDWTKNKKDGVTC